MSHRYAAYGLVLDSQIELPYLTPAPMAVPTVTVRIGDVAKHLSDAAVAGATFEASREQFLLNLEGTGRFIVERGTHITIEPCTPGSFAWGYVFGGLVKMLLLQRGIFVLHAASIAIRGRAVIFAGRSTQGQSTLAAEMIRRGHRFLSDDFTVIVRNADGQFSVQPGMAAVKLWQDAVDAIGWSGRPRVPIRPGLQKFQIPLTDPFTGNDAALGAAFVVRIGHEPNVTQVRLSPVEAFDWLRLHLVRGDLLRTFGTLESAFKTTAQISVDTPAFRLTRTSARWCAGEMADAVESAL